jgi:hypothetical protein
MAITTGAVLAYIGSTLRSGEATHLTRSVEPVLPLALVPTGWMVLQVVPFPGLAHSIWASAEATLGGSIAGRISIDPGMTILAIGQFLLGVGVTIAAMALTLDRQKAEWALSALVLVTATMALIVVGHDLSGATFLGEMGHGTRSAFDTASAFGVVLSLATADLAIERYETRGSRAGMSIANLVERLSGALVALVLCAFAVGYFLRGPLPFATACGAATFVLLILVRRLGGSPWIGWSVGAAALIAVSMVVAGQWGAGGAPLPIRFSGQSPSGLAATARMLADASWVGTGAGTFTMLQGAYRDVVDPVLAEPPTFAAGLTIELGRAAPWVAIALAGWAAALLVRGSLRRGRDSFYAAAAAGCLVVSVIAAFDDAGSRQPGTMVLTALVLGLGLSQRESRTAR